MAYSSLIADCQFNICLTFAQGLNISVRRTIISAFHCGDRRVRSGPDYIIIVGADIRVYIERNTMIVTGFYGERCSVQG